MKKINLNNLLFWQFHNLSEETSIQHFVTDRNSVANGKEFTLSYSSSPDKEAIRQNRTLVARAIGISESKLFLPSQVHKTRIATVTSSTVKEDLLETDALITNERGIGVAVMSADCVPILLYDKRNHAAGAVHSGWRGTVAKILDKTLREMNHRFGTTGEDIVAGIGPSVSQESYEVGEEVVNEVIHSFGNPNDLLMMQPDQKARLDLWKANKVQLLEFGVPESNIEISDLCTVIHNQHFFSARKGDTGRFAAGIVLV